MRKLGVGATVLAVLLLTASAFAAVGATIVLTNGQRVRADIFDMNAQGVVGRVNGSERSWNTGEIAVIDFAGDGNNFPSNELDRAGSGLLVLRDGSLVSGRLVDIGGSNPLRITFSGRDYSSCDVAHLLLASGGSDDVAGPGEYRAGTGPREHPCPRLQRMGVDGHHGGSGRGD